MFPISYKALYRVFRPQLFNEVVGQEPITQTLRNAIKENRISHAYLFNGPRGTGKTSAAKLFAKAVNCENPQEGEPCNQCPSCIGIQNGTIMDIMEIDAASNRGVDEIRDIREKVMLRPSAISYKVYIIDEVHMLTTEAFNALLKTLEEPPSHVIFILATTEPHKLPLTIISRCQRFDFRKIPLESLVARMRWVCEQKGILITDETLSLIAKFSEGGMRDALSLLDQVYSFAGDTISPEDIYLITGAVSQDFVGRILLELKEHQVANALTLLDEVLMSGKDPEQILRSLIQYVRDILIYQNAPELDEMVNRTHLDPNFISLSNHFRAEELYGTIEYLNKVQNEMKWTNHPRILVEVAFIQLSEQVLKEKEVKEDIEDQYLQRILQLENKIEQLQKSGFPMQSAVPEVQSSPPSTRQGSFKGTGSKDFPIVKLKSLMSESNHKFLQRMRQLWPSILESVRQKEVRTEAWLKQGHPVLVTENAILLVFGVPMHRNMTEKPENKNIVLEAIVEMTNRQFELFTIMDEQWQEFQEKHIKPSEEREETDPLIKSAIELVGEELVKIKK